MNMAISLLWCIILTISFTSVSSSTHVRSSDDPGLFVGSYAVSPSNINGVVSICEVDGIFYMAAKRVSDGTDYIETVARATGGVTVTADTISLNWEGHRFFQDTSGTAATSGIVRYNTETGEYIGIVEDLGMNSFDKISDDPEICLAPGGKWTDFDTPVMAESKDLSEDMCQALLGIDNCVEFQRYDSVTAEGGACWCYYDFDQEECIEGGDLSINVRFDWDMSLRITEYTDLGSTECPSGSSFQLVTEQDEILISWKCTGVMVGAFYFLDTETDTMDGECPLFEAPNPPMKMNENILENDNDNEHSEIVITFSKATIVNLWVGVILFLLINTVLCWCMRTRTHQKRSRRVRNVSFEIYK